MDRSMSSQKDSRDWPGLFERAGIEQITAVSGGVLFEALSQL